MKNEEMKALEQEIESSKRIIAAAEKSNKKKKKQENIPEDAEYEYEVLRTRGNTSYSINTYKNIEDALKLVTVLKNIEISNSDEVFNRYHVSTKRKF